MEEAARAGGGRLLQLACGGDRNHTRGHHRNCRVAVGTRGTEAKSHSVDASGDGMRIDRSDLGGVVHPSANATEPGGDSAWISVANRGCRRIHRRTNGTPWRLSQRSEWAGIASGYEQSSPEICDTGKGFFDARHTRGGAQPYFEGIRIRPSGARRQPGRDLLHLRGIAADLYGAAHRLQVAR